jgi:hypothetical protein
LYLSFPRLGCVCTLITGNVFRSAKKHFLFVFCVLFGNFSIKVIGLLLLLLYNLKQGHMSRKLRNVQVCFLLQLSDKLLRLDISLCNLFLFFSGRKVLHKKIEFIFHLFSRRSICFFFLIVI